MASSRADKWWDEWAGEWLLLYMQGHLDRYRGGTTLHTNSVDKYLEALDRGDEHAKLINAKLVAAKLAA